jgi:hypothetical protein
MLTFPIIYYTKMLAYHNGGGMSGLGSGGTKKGIKTRSSIHPNVSLVYTLFPLILWINVLLSLLQGPFLRLCLQDILLQ